MPNVGVSRQPMMFISVDLPLPDGPSTERNSPSSMSRSMPLRIVCSSSPIRYCFTIPRIEKNSLLIGASGQLREVLLWRAISMSSFMLMPLGLSTVSPAESPLVISQVMPSLMPTVTGTFAGSSSPEAM